MKKAKAVLAALLAAGLTVGSAVPALAFYQQPQSKKGLLLSQQTADMLADIANLGVKHAERCHPDHDSHKPPGCPGRYDAERTGGRRRNLRL